MLDKNFSPQRHKGAEDFSGNVIKYHENQDIFLQTSFK